MRNDLMSVLLKAEDVRGYYETLRGTIKAVDGVTFSVNKGETIGIAGESGCGKSTLAKVLMAYTKPPLYIKGGKVIINGSNIFKLSRSELRRIRGKWLSFVPQSSMNALNPTKKLKDLITDLMKVHQKAEFSEDKTLKATIERFENLGLNKDIIDHYPHELSGGMRQRSVIAISTLLNPKLLIADEPTSALDVSSQKMVLKMLQDIKKKKLVQSILFISHDVATLRQVCEKCIIMYAGKIVEMGDMADIVSKPLHPYTRGLISSVLSPSRGVRKKSLTGIRGVPPSLMELPEGCRFQPRCKSDREICESDPPLVKVDGRSVACWRFSKKVN